MTLCDSAFGHANNMFGCTAIVALAHGILGASITPDRNPARCTWTGPSGHTYDFTCVDVLNSQPKLTKLSQSSSSASLAVGELNRFAIVLSVAVVVETYALQLFTGLWELKGT